MTAQDGSGIGGRAELSPADGGAKTQIGVYLNDVTDGSMHPAHVHVSSTCEEGPHVADLNDVVANGTTYGRSITVVDVPFSFVANGKNIILAHGDNDSVVACGKIPAQPAAAALPKALPSTGSAGGASNNSETLLLLAALLLTGTLIAASGITAVRRSQ
jgi:hypothetical protein